MNLIGYVKEFGDKTFSVMHFNSIDALILSQMSYVNFDLLNVDKGFIKLKDLKLSDDKKVYEESYDAFDNKRMMKMLVSCRRFRNVKVGYFHKDYDEEANKQFVAVTFVLPDDTGFISYRGTDLSMMGWREDLYIAFRDHMPGATDATEYLEKVVKKFKGNFYAGGHSKGGNLAIYATLHMNPELSERLLNVYSFDGPGFRTKIKENKNYHLVKDKVVKYLTSNDMIGVIYNNNEDAKIVYSSGVLLGGHDPYRWSIDKQTVDFVFTKDRSYMSKKYEEALMGWLAEMDDDDKALAVHIIFEMMGESKTVYDLLLNAGRLAVSGKKTWDNYSPRQRERAREIFKKLGKYFLSAYSPRQFLRERFAHHFKDDVHR